MKSRVLVFALLANASMWGINAGSHIHDNESTAPFSIFVIVLNVLCALITVCGGFGE